MWFSVLAWQAAVLIMPISSNIIQKSPDYEKYNMPARPSNFVDVPVSASNHFNVPVSKMDFVNVPTINRGRPCQNRINNIPTNVVQWSPYANNVENKIVKPNAVPVNNMPRTPGTLPNNIEFRSVRSKKGLGSTLENIKTQLASLAEYVLASYDLIQTANQELTVSVSNLPVNTASYQWNHYNQPASLRFK